MVSFVFFALLLATLFCFSFFTKRRFGVLGLGLTAGSLLSANWSATLTPFIEQQGVILVSPPLSAIVQTVLILLPPLILFLSGPTYNRTWPRLGGSIAFTLLAFTFLLQPIGSAVLLEGAGMEVYKIFSTYQSLIIVAGIVTALIDILLTRKPKGKGAH
jgi:hypothetical protein